MIAIIGGSGLTQLANLEITLITAHHSKLTPTATEDLYRRLSNPQAFAALRNQHALAWLPSYWYLGLFHALNGDATPGVPAAAWRAGFGLLKLRQVLFCGILVLPILTKFHELLDLDGGIHHVSLLAINLSHQEIESGLMVIRVNSNGFQDTFLCLWKIAEMELG